MFGAGAAAQRAAQFLGEGSTHLRPQETADAQRAAAVGELDQRALPGRRLDDEPVGVEFGALDKLTRASVTDLAAVDGVGEHWAETIKDALARIAESSILDRYS